MKWHDTRTPMLLRSISLESLGEYEIRMWGILRHRPNRIFKQSVRKARGLRVRLEALLGTEMTCGEKNGNNGVGNRIREPANRIGYQASVPCRDNGLPNSSLLEKIRWKSPCIIPAALNTLLPFIPLQSGPLYQEDPRDTHKVCAYLSLTVFCYECQPDSPILWPTSILL